MEAGDTAAALTGVQSVYRVFFVPLDDALVGLAPGVCPMRLARSFSHSAFRKAPSIAREVPYSFASSSLCEMIFCIAERLCCISTNGDSGLSDPRGVWRPSGLHSGASTECTGGKRIGCPLFCKPKWSTILSPIFGSLKSRTYQPIVSSRYGAPALRVSLLRRHNGLRALVRGKLLRSLSTSQPFACRGILFLPDPAHFAKDDTYQHITLRFRPSGLHQPS